MNPNPNDAKVAVPLPGTTPQPERETLPLPGPAAPDTTPGDARSTAPLVGSGSDPFPLGGTDAHPLPKTIGRFAVRAWLGSGAFGDVYRAHDPQLDREVALKVAKPGSLDTPERLARFLREAKSAANLRHPSIVPLYETGRDGERLFIATAFINGRTLEAVIAEANETGQPIPLDTAAQVVRKLADALAYAHSQGIVHRDVKPANVMVDGAGEPHLLDFGLAARAEEGAERLTQDGQGMGTPAYMAPEQADGSGVAASDQYSLGCALYELLTGQTPFAGGPAQQIFLHKTQPVPPVRKSRRDVPRDLDTVVAKCVEKEPGRRYGSCAELAEDLRRFLGGEPVAVRSAGVVERTYKWAKRKPTAAAAYGLTGLAVALAAVVFVVAVFWQNAERAKDEAEDAKGQAVVAKGEAETARDQLKGANGELVFVNGQLDGARKKAEIDRDLLKEANRKLDDLVVRLKESEDRIAFLNYAHLIQLAQNEYDANDLVPARRHLSVCVEERRGWEWHYLNRLCNQSSVTYEGHLPGGIQIGIAAFSPDGTKVLSADRKGFAKVWDASTGKDVAVIKGHALFVTAAAFDHTGTKVVTCGNEGITKVWNAATGKLLATTARHADQITGVAFSPDDTKLATTSADKTARIWDATTGKELTVCTGHEQEVRSPSFSPDGTRLATASVDHTARVWNAITGREVAVMKGHTQEVFTVAFSPDGKHVVTAADEDTGLPPVRVWDAATGKERVAMKGHQKGVFKAAYSRDGRKIVTAGGWDSTACVWDAQDGVLHATCKGHTGRVFDASFDHTGTRIVTAGEDKTARIWDVAPNLGGKHLITLTGHTGAVLVARFSPDGDRVLTAGADATARVWSAGGGAVAAKFAVPFGNPHINKGAPAAFHPTAPHLATVDQTGSITVWNLTTGREERKWKPVAHPLSIAYSRDGAKLVVLEVEKDARVYDAKTGEELTVFRQHAALPSIAGFNRDGTAVVSVGWHDKVRVWDAATGAERLAFDAGRAINWAEFDPTGTRILTAGTTSPVKVWDASTGKPLLTLGAPNDWPQTANYTPDGTAILTTDAKTGIRLWDATTGSLRFAFPPTERVREFVAAGFSRDGTRVVTVALNESAAWVWDVATGKELVAVRGHEGKVTWAGFGPEGRTLATAGADGQLLLHSGRPVNR